MTNPFANSFPVAAPADAHWTDTVVQQGHVDYCATNGHAEWVIDGEIQPRCPRCGAVTAEAEAEAEEEEAQPIIDWESAWDYLIEAGVSEESLILITSINGTSLETMESVLYSRFGYRSFDQLMGE
jgi:hypothetical protein